ncbi:MAG: c-type cytochrome [Opitutus sp.]|nr:c-type cytochrome [Opitutus sp.]
MSQAISVSGNGQQAGIAPHGSAHHVLAPMRPRCFIRASLGWALLSAVVASAQSPVSMLAPGFTVRELPLKVTNLNNLRFTPDGRLSALGYDGRVHIFTDSDGDGLEDTDTLFWDKSTLSVPVGMAWSKDGLYVSSHGKVSLLRDTDGDGRADVEEIVASGWPATDVTSGGVDATAVTLDTAGNVYFGLLTASYLKPYRVKDGVSRYDLNGPRGSIQKLSATTGRLETIATGIRVPYTLAFNRHGDLFVTDQEGATWVPDGNPLDELNHIIPGRNYGFPPRHETHLPGLISEPPVIGFGPQHQSACGFVFNEPNARQKRFGPAGWENDVLVAGESRGKIWRARLVQTPEGYVGRETTIARLSLLTLDVAISPAGDLYVACHTGTPDWGTGPKGAGKVFKISHTDSAAPQPVAIWASAPLEVSVAFDRAIDAAVILEIASAQIEFGDHVSAADRFQVLKPPYKTVKAQDGVSRGKLRVAAARLPADARTLVLTTDPHPLSVPYALTLPGVKAAGAATPATVDLAYDLNGVEATWIPAGTGAAVEWKGWLPHLTSEVNAAFTVQSAEHERLAGLWARPGRLQLRTQIALAGGNATLRLRASAPFTVSIAQKKYTAQAGASRAFALEIPLKDAGSAAAIAIELETTAGRAPTFSATYSSEPDPTVRPMPFAAFLLPWAAPHRIPPSLENEKTELAGGDFERGRALFFGKQAACATCHQIRGEGGVVGPDLSGLVQRDAASVLRDIREPSAMINPDFVAYQVQLHNGESLVGYVRTQDAAALRIAGPDGKVRVVVRADVAEMRPSPVSLMPPGLIDALTELQVRDLLTFLVNGPPVRTPAEVAAVLRTGEKPAAAVPVKPLSIVLVASKQDHGKGQHDYPAWQKLWHALLGRAPGVTVAEAWEWPSAEQWGAADAIVMNFRNRNWGAGRLAQIDDFQKRGGGLVVFHAATIIDRLPEQLAERFGLAAQPGPTKYLHTPVTLKFTASAEQPITRGFNPLALLDEPYWPMFGDVKKIQVLATGEVEGKVWPLVWTFEKGPGRVFGSIPGHYTWTFEDPLYRILALRGLAWACREPASRFEAIGAGAAGSR